MRCFRCQGDHHASECPLTARGTIGVIPEGETECPACEGTGIDEDDDACGADCPFCLGTGTAPSFRMVARRGVMP